MSKEFLHLTDVYTGNSAVFLPEVIAGWYTSSVGGYSYIKFKDRTSLPVKESVKEIDIEYNRAKEASKNV